jgi:hypothetical protein
MPFKSKAQRRKFAQLLVEGKISDETYEEWNRSTGGKALPERVGAAKAAKAAKKRTPPKKAAGKKAARKRTARKKAVRTKTAGKKAPGKKKRPAGK